MRLSTARTRVRGAAHAKAPRLGHARSSRASAEPGAILGGSSCKAQENVMGETPRFAWAVPSSPRPPAREDEGTGPRAICRSALVVRPARRHLLEYERFEASHRLAQMMSQLAPPGVVDPPFEADLERRDTGFGREVRGEI